MLTNHKLGLCCLTVDQPKLKMQTMTRKRFLELDRKLACGQLSGRILNNCRVTFNTIKFCVENNIQHYRLSSSIFPLIGEPNCNVSLKTLGIEEEVKQILFQAGNYAKQNNISLSSHPSQFTVLFSDNEKINNNSIFDLETHGFLHDSLGFPQNHTNPINIHPTGKFENIPSSADIFVKNFNRCSQSVKSRLVLENCDKGMWNCQKLYDLHVFLAANKSIFVPLTFDNLHDKCLPSLDEKCWCSKFAETWKTSAPIFHWSEGGAKGKIRSHLDDFTHVPKVVANNPHIIWECEVKNKNLAIEKIKKTS